MNAVPDTTGRPERRRQLAAIAAIATALATVVVAAVTLWSYWDDLVLSLVCLGVAVVAAWYVLATRGARRVVAVFVLVVAIVGVIVFVTGDRGLLLLLAVAVLAFTTAGLARFALHADRTSLRDAAPPGIEVPAAVHPVLLYNPKSGGGKADVEFVAAAEARGIRADRPHPTPPTSNSSPGT